MDLKETGWKDVGWIHIAHDWDQTHVLVSKIINVDVSFSRRYSEGHPLFSRFWHRVV
jgi:hypothetical protein